MIGAQAAAMLAVLALAAVPPASGPMLVVPLGGSATAALIGGARLVGQGPLPGSLVVDGERATLLPHLWRHGALALAAPSFGCGGAAA
jgi:hypothetical protein